jgi:hypothetical protein
MLMYLVIRNHSRVITKAVKRHVHGRNYFTHSFRLMLQSFIQQASSYDSISKKVFQEYAVSPAHRTSKRSKFITLFHVRTKSVTNFSFASALP